jgi:AraC-like DNA-binding protein
LATSSALGLAGAELSSAGSNALFRLKSVIEAHLREPDLRPAAVAAQVGISVRYANSLLSKEGSSLERFILQRRLERCRQALEDAAQAHRMIGEIAFSWGFSDLSHFGRRFRSTYGLSPGDYRRRMQEAAGGQAGAGPQLAHATTPK